MSELAARIIERSRWLQADERLFRIGEELEDFASEVRILEQRLAELEKERIENRAHLRFVWRWVDRLNGGKPHDKPEENWRRYVGTLTSYPWSPHQTGEWYEDEIQPPREGES